MGKKIPGKKHHGTKDPEKQAKARLDKIKMKVEPLVGEYIDIAIVPDQRPAGKGGPPGRAQVAAHADGRQGADQGNRHILAVSPKVRPEKIVTMRKCGPYYKGQPTY
jgi:hypothetical protein